MQVIYRKSWTVIARLHRRVQIRQDTKRSIRPAVSLKHNFLKLHLFALFQYKPTKATLWQL